VQPGSRRPTFTTALLAPRGLAVLLIEAYQRFVSPYKGFACAYRVHTGCASCSKLGLRAVRRYGVWQGLGVLQARFERCGEAYRQRLAQGHSRRLQRGVLDCGGADCSPGDSCDCFDVGDCACDALDIADCCDRRREPSLRRRKNDAGRTIYIPPPRRHESTVRDGAKLPFQREPVTADTPAISARELINMRLVDAPHRQVYGAFGNPQRLARWWLPEGSSGFDAFDLKPGGDWHFSTTKADGTRQDHHHLFVEVRPPERVTFDVLSGMRCRITVSFGERGEKTLVRLRALFDTAAACDAARAGMQAAHEQMLDRLEAAVRP
jgi:uncharacterized protein YndB with AHSA1/START domain/putative component of membrane protein insertase Oxa1/YidC/SpoIIIJ protein YidD